jgi:hypothetical protein
MVINYINYIKYLKNDTYKLYDWYLNKRKYLHYLLNMLLFHSYLFLFIKNKKDKIIELIKIHNYYPYIYIL